MLPKQSDMTNGGRMTWQRLAGAGDTASSQPLPSYSPHVLHAARPWDTSLQALFSAWPFLPGFGSCSGIALRPGPGAFLVLA